ncbi:uncharacterized protein L3040_003010 [Drepanopeziza brunnea f. sp. 'multigermtubi']|uniref:uncharacterized protein n=1 Tax=Drepanopeziza brunnea f. sp. 'multigermtubi' TaxID=698441 RepID=UPI00238B7BDA|nr:hypothetical protein L3040_003010 [Drepanopeziza brunnea f. sp. 'multigermtubi']
MCQQVTTYFRCGRTAASVSVKCIIGNCRQAQQVSAPELPPCGLAACGVCMCNRDDEPRELDPSAKAFRPAFRFGKNVVLN